MDAEEMSEDRGRCGMVMAAREGKLWEGGASKMGCAACSSKARGYRWERGPGGEWEWRLSLLGCEARRADLWHVACGECEGVDQAVRGEVREAIRKSLQRGLRTVTQKHARSGGNVVGTCVSVCRSEVAAAGLACVRLCVCVCVCF